MPWELSVELETAREMIHAQINPLVSALTWLTWLVGASLILVLISLLCVVGWHEQSTTTAIRSAKNTPVESTLSAHVMTPALLKGKDLFVANCGQCHEVGNGVVVGPGLLGVSSRVPSQQWLVNWIRNPLAVVGSGDMYARTIIKKFAPVVMPGFANLSEKDINAIIEYINSHKATMLYAR